jgi:hypothetical protein
MPSVQDEQVVLHDSAQPGRQPAVLDWLQQSRWVSSWVSIVALVLWAGSLPFVDVTRISGWGLLTGLPTVWYVAYALALSALIFGLTAERSSVLGPVAFQLVRRMTWMPCLLVVILMLFATTAIVYDAPRFPWTYKHIGVTEYLLLHGTPARDLDIYQNFPGFFYGAGVLHEISRIPLLLMARYAEFISTGVNALAVYWAVGALSRNARVRALTVVIFTLANWIGQSYFAPQALAFPAGIFVIGALLRLIANGHGRPKLGPLLKEVRRGSGHPSRSAERDFWGRRESVVLTCAVFAIMVVSHQFTPVAVVVQVAVLTVLFRLRFPWLIAFFALLEGLWVLNAYSYLSKHFTLLQAVNYDNVRPPTALKAVLPGSQLMVQVPHVVTAIVAICAIAGAARTFRRTKSVTSLLIPTLLALSPALIVVVQPYGQEGILRSYLLALPWCSFVIARDLLGAGWGLQRSAARMTATIALTFVLGILAVPALLGNELINRVSRADVTADAWFEQRCPRGSELLLLVPAYPSRSTGLYDQHILIDDPLSPALLKEVNGFSSAAKSGASMTAFTRAYVQSRQAQHDLYLALGPTQHAYVRLYGLMSDSVWDDYVARLQKDKKFTVVYAADGSYLFRVN